MRSLVSLSLKCTQSKTACNAARKRRTAEDSKTWLFSFLVATVHGRSMPDSLSFDRGLIRRWSCRKLDRDTNAGGKPGIQPRGAILPIPFLNSLSSLHRPVLFTLESEGRGDEQSPLDSSRWSCWGDTYSERMHQHKAARWPSSLTLTANRPRWRFYAPSRLSRLHRFRFLAHFPGKSGLRPRRLKRRDCSRSHSH